jgi:hypothetical protein
MTDVDAIVAFLSFWAAFWGMVAIIVVAVFAARWIVNYDA